MGHGHESAVRRGGQIITAAVIGDFAEGLPAGMHSPDLALKAQGLVAGGHGVGPSRGADQGNTARIDEAPDIDRRHGYRFRAMMREQGAKRSRGGAESCRYFSVAMTSSGKGAARTCS